MNCKREPQKKKKKKKKKQKTEGAALMSQLVRLLLWKEIKRFREC